jgi:hypothetical protein
MIVDSQIWIILIFLNWQKFPTIFRIGVLLENRIYLLVLYMVVRKVLIDKLLGRAHHIELAMPFLITKKNSICISYYFIFLHVLRADLRKSWIDSILNILRWIKVLCLVYLRGLRDVISLLGVIILRFFSYFSVFINCR